MPTQNPRVNITLDTHDLGLLTQYAGKEKKSLSAAAKHLILQALELQEDLHFSKLSEKRLKETSIKNNKRISHADAWK